MNDKAKTALVVGGGLAGMEAALKIGQAGYKVFLVEKETVLGGVLRQLYSSFPRWENPQDLLNNKVQQLGLYKEISILIGMTVKTARREKDAFIVDLQGLDEGDNRQIVVDAVVLATGFELFDASLYGEYGYGIYPNVMNSLEFEAKLKEWGSGQENSQPPQAVAFFKCVGSRDRSKGYPYCSKICCMYTAKQAGVVKDMFPAAKSYVFYMDYRAAGKEYEEFVRSVIETKHVRYVRGRPSKVIPENGRLLVRAEDTLMGVPIEVEVDMVVLAAAIVPRKETKMLAEYFGARTDQYGFLDHDTFNPAKVGDRVFFAGACGFAVETQGAQYQGAAAAAEVIALFNQGGE
ncbi:MAG: FAD-dependent oxidoreductase [Bacillota bacterium]|nr:FAD-dependent oxidoreductase [Bacillota bacterium]